jgi:hydroxymethylpyrimidine pyrophosphatase-like HAD family hydrolase
MIPTCIKSNHAVMFDIDDTLISSVTGKRIDEAFNLYVKAKNNGYKIIIITARPGFYENVRWTRDQLNDLKVEYNELIFTSPQGKSMYKRESGYVYILSVGDMDTDLTDSKHSIKISR